MGLFSLNKNTSNLTWIPANDIKTIDEYILNSSQKPVLFFKHSSRCSISSMAQSRFEREWSVDEEKCSLVFIDIIAHRAVSNYLSECSGVVHQSPQVILMKGEKVVYTASHSGIDAKEIANIVFDDF